MIPIENLHEINILNNRIAELYAKKRTYENMRTQISETANKLLAAKNNIENSSQQLKQAYSSDESSDKVTEMEDMCTEITNNANELNGKILEEINKKVNQISRQISNLEAEKRKLMTQPHCID